MTDILSIENIEDHYAEVSHTLVEANELVSGERKIQYGDFIKNHEDIAKVWSVITGIKLDAHQVLLMMSSLKIVRASKPGSYLHDNYVDAAAYLSMANAFKKTKDNIHE